VSEIDEVSGRGSQSNLAEVLEQAYADYWGYAPPDGWGTYGAWDCVADAAVQYLLGDQ
jgi:hypothetical protein